eukprot:357494-Chlamydomonas_euryale.AAC.3
MRVQPGEERVRPNGAAVHGTAASRATVTSRLEFATPHLTRDETMGRPPGGAVATARPGRRRRSPSAVAFRPPGG